MYLNVYIVIKLNLFLVITYLSKIQGKSESGALSNSIVNQKSISEIVESDKNRSCNLTYNLLEVVVNQASP